MADTLPLNFPIPQENIISSYTFQDIAQNVSYATYYAVIDRTGAGILSPSGIETDQEYWRISKTTASGSEEWNFDLTFKRPVTIEGKLMVVCTYGGKKGTGSAPQSYETVEIFHVNATATETSIGTEQTGETYNYGGDTNVRSYRKLFIFDITKKTFGIGEKLRVEVVTNWVNDTSGTPSQAYFWFDGMNRAEAGNDPSSDGTAYFLNSQDTDFKVYVPYKPEQ